MIWFLTLAFLACVVFHAAAACIPTGGETE